MLEILSSFVDLLKEIQISPVQGVKPVSEDKPPEHGTSEPRKKGSKTVVYIESMNYRMKNLYLACIILYH